MKNAGNDFSFFFSLLLLLFAYLIFFFCAVCVSRITSFIVSKLNQVRAFLLCFFVLHTVHTEKSKTEYVFHKQKLMSVFFFLFIRNDMQRMYFVSQPSGFTIIVKKIIK